MLQQTGTRFILCRRVYLLLPFFLQQAQGRRLVIPGGGTHGFPGMLCFEGILSGTVVVLAGHGYLSAVQGNCGCIDGFCGARGTRFRLLPDGLILLQGQGRRFFSGLRNGRFVRLPRHRNGNGNGFFFLLFRDRLFPGRGKDTLLLPGRAVGRLRLFLRIGRIGGGLRLSLRGGRHALRIAGEWVMPSWLVESETPGVVWK